MAVMSFCSPDSYSKCHWHNGRPPLASFDHPCCVREVLVWILGGRRGALDNRQSPHPFLEESALTGNLKFTFKCFISFNSFTEAVHSLKCVRKTHVRFFLYQHLRHISERERERDEAPPSPHRFQFQIHHSRSLPTTPAHSGLEKDHPDGTETSHNVYVLKKKF